MPAVDRAQPRREGYAKSRETRALLLAAALAEASEHGLHRMSVAGIASRANTAIGTVNYHFGSRDALVRELIQQLLNDLYARLAEAGDATRGGDFYERHRGDLLAYVEFVRANPAHVRLTDEIKYVDPELYRQGVSGWVEILEAKLREGIAEGALRPMSDAEVRANAHFLLGGRHFLEALVDDIGQDEVVVDTYLTLVRDGLGVTHSDREKEGRRR